MRHRYDYGAILLCDERFALSKNISNLPLWLRANVHLFHDFEESSKKLNNFFAHVESNVNNLITRENVGETLLNTPPQQSCAPIACNQFNSAKKLRLPTLLSQKSTAMTVKIRDSRVNFLESLNYKDDYQNKIVLCIDKKEQSQEKINSLINIFSKRKSPVCGLVSVDKKVTPLRSQTEADRITLSNFGTQERVAKSQEYAQVVKKVLNPSEYRNFEEIFLKYTKDNYDDVYSMLQEIASFLSSINHWNLFEEFSLFINETNYQKYLQVKSKYASKVKSKKPPGQQGSISLFVTSSAPQLDCVTKKQDVVPIESIKIDIKGCLLCSKPPDDPYSAKCGHICCFECWASWLERCFECPLCKCRTRPKHLLRTPFERLN